MKVKNVKSLRSDKKAVKEAIEKVVELVQLWLDKGNIAGVVDFDKIIRREDYEEIEYWLYNLRVIGLIVCKT